MDHNDLNEFLDHFDGEELMQLFECHAQGSEQLQAHHLKVGEGSRAESSLRGALLPRQQIQKRSSSSSSASDSSASFCFEKQRRHLHFLRKEVDDLEQCVRAVQRNRQRRRLRKQRQQLICRRRCSNHQPTHDLFFHRQVQIPGGFESRSALGGTPTSGPTDRALFDVWAGDPTASWCDSLVFNDSDSQLHQEQVSWSSTKTDLVPPSLDLELPNLLQPYISEESHTPRDVSNLKCIQDHSSHSHQMIINALSSTIDGSNHLSRAVASHDPTSSIQLVASGHVHLAAGKEANGVQIPEMNALLTQEEHLQLLLALLHDGQQKALAFLNQLEG